MTSAFFCQRIRFHKSWGHPTSIEANPLNRHFWPYWHGLCKSAHLLKNNLKKLSLDPVEWLAPKLQQVCTFGCSLQNFEDGGHPTFKETSNHILKGLCKSCKVLPKIAHLMKFWCWSVNRVKKYSAGKQHLGQWKTLIIMTSRHFWLLQCIWPQARVTYPS